MPENEALETNVVPFARINGRILWASTLPDPPICTLICVCHYERCSNENMGEGSGWTLKVGRSKLRWSNVERNDMNKKGVMIKEAQVRRTCRLKTLCADSR